MRPPKRSAKEKSLLTKVRLLLSVNQNSMRPLPGIQSTVLLLMWAHAKKLFFKRPAFMVMSTFSSTLAFRRPRLFLRRGWHCFTALQLTKPKHPVHHYRIHLFDEMDREVSLKGVYSADVSGSSAPDLAHQWHMASHLYGNLDRISEASWMTEASIRTDHRTLIRADPRTKIQYQTMPYEIHNYRHHSDYFLRTLWASGRANRALQYANSIRRIPQPMNAKDRPIRNILGLLELSQGQSLRTASIFELWAEGKSLSEREDVKKSEVMNIQWARLLFLAKAAVLKEVSVSAAEEQISRVEELLSAQTSSLDVESFQEMKQELEEIKSWLLLSAQGISSNLFQEKAESLKSSQAFSPFDYFRFALYFGTNELALHWAQQLEARYLLSDRGYDPVRWFTLTRANVIQGLIASGQREEALQYYQKHQADFALADAASPVFNFLNEPDFQALGLIAAKLPPVAKNFDSNAMGSLAWEPISAPQIPVLKNREFGTFSLSREGLFLLKPSLIQI